MYQHLDLMAAQSMAREREHDLQTALGQRRRPARPAAADLEPVHPGRHHWMHDLLVRVHLAHTPVH